MGAELLFARLSGAVPEIATMFRDHLDSFDRLLPYVLFSEVIAWAEDRTLASDSAAHEILKVTEDVYPEATAELRAMIDIELLENLSRQSRLAPLLGPNLSRTFEEFRAIAEM